MHPYFNIRLIRRVAATSGYQTILKWLRKAQNIFENNEKLKSPDGKIQKILQARMIWFDRENVFPQNDIDGQKTAGNLLHEHLKAVRRLGFDFRLYDCRHTFATRAVQSGMDLVVLASILGHSSLKMVMRYAHPSENSKADAIRKMEKAKAV